MFHSGLVGKPHPLTSNLKQGHSSGGGSCLLTSLQLEATWKASSMPELNWTTLLFSKLEIMHTALSPTHSCMQQLFLWFASVIWQGSSRYCELRLRYTVCSWIIHMKLFLLLGWKFTVGTSFNNVLWICTKNNVLRLKIGVHRSAAFLWWV